MARHELSGWGKQTSTDLIAVVSEPLTGRSRLSGTLLTRLVEKGCHGKKNLAKPLSTLCWSRTKVLGLVVRMWKQGLLKRIVRCLKSNSEKWPYLWDLNHSCSSLEEKERSRRLSKRSAHYVIGNLCLDCWLVLFVAIVCCAWWFFCRHER